ncbi:MAG: hypothetical protein JXX28_00575 [Deltaproteobacteria bacterium]|nr:hypothetical protein [Deltaproteobacteria bacterium]
MTDTPRSRLLPGCLVALAVALLTAGGGAAWVHHRSQLAQAQALAAQETHAEEVFSPALQAMEEASETAAPDYDIDKTIRVLHGLDAAIQHQDSLDAYLDYLARQDYRGVAPEVLKARQELLELLLQLYKRQTEADDQQALWDFSSQLILSTLSVVEVDGTITPITPVGSISVDREKAQELLSDFKAQQASRKTLLKEITALEQDLFRAQVAYSEAWYTYVEEWDRVSVQRDRAWLAVREGAWDEARAASEAAIRLAPHEREAHLIQAMSLIEGGTPEDDPVIAELLDGYMEQHPESTAPALLLKGSLAARRGHPEEARLLLQQASAYYPRQAEQLTDMLDPYEMRGYLRKSRDGNGILEQYKATMLGAGYYSPDLQLARAAFEAGRFEEGKTRVMDHFARRRAQAQWDFVLSDIAFCQELMGPWYREIFPAETWLDLQVSPTTFGSGLNLAVNNRSDRTLHNATLILVLHFTDMQPDDYETVTAERTLPAVNAHDLTDFGSVEVAVDVLGSTKGSGDIVHHRAILVSNEAVLWVDTDAFRIAEDEAFREARRHQPPQEAEAPSYRTTLDGLVDQARAETSVEIESRYGADAVLIKLPKELSILKPIMRLKYGDQIFTASDNLIEGDHIALRFKGVDNFDDAPSGDNLELLIGSPFGDIALDWTWEGEMAYRLLPATKPAP